MYNSLLREEQLKILGQMKDSDIDYSDAAPTDAEFWKNAVLHIPLEKVQVSIRLDENAIARDKKAKLETIYLNHEIVRNKPTMSLNISLPEAMRTFIDEQVKTGGYETVSEYLRELIRDDQKRKSQEKLEAL